MAYLNGKWLARVERQREIEQRIDMIAEYDRLAQAGELTAYDIDQWDIVDAELEKLNRVNDCEYNLLLFMHEYFSEERNPGNPDNLIPAGITYDNAAEFHRTLCALLDEITMGKSTNHRAWCTARGTAKTAYTSNGYLCHQLVFRHRKYIVEVSETTDVAGDFIQWAANQLRHNQKLRDDFGSLLYEKKSMNTVDNKYEFVTTTGAKVEAKGTGTQVRGMRWGNSRPELYILDDLESRDNTNTPELIEKSKRWFREELMPALAANGICIYIGTIVAYNCLLDYVIRERRDFTSRKFPAILDWSEREDLWDKWRQIYKEDAPDAQERADRFFEENKDEMLRGTSVLWWERYSYLDLMKIKEENGARAFNQEYLGNPVDTEIQVFSPESFVWYTDDDLLDLSLDYYCGVDFALGKEKGDFSAIITIGRSKNGICYVVDAFIERCHPDILLKTVVDKALHYQYAGMAVESQQAQEWFAHKLKEELQRNGYPGFTRITEVKQRVRKQLRIESLLPDIQSGKLRFSRKHRRLIEQFELYPQTHDDGPDGTHMAFSIAREGKRKVIDKPSWI